MKYTNTSKLTDSETYLLSTDKKKLDELASNVDAINAYIEEGNFNWKTLEDKAEYIKVEPGTIVKLECLGDTLLLDYISDDVYVAVGNSDTFIMVPGGYITTLGNTFTCSYTGTGASIVEAQEGVSRKITKGVCIYGQTNVELEDEYSFSSLSVGALVNTGTAVLNEATITTETVDTSTINTATINTETVENSTITNANLSVANITNDKVDTATIKEATITTNTVGTETVDNTRVNQVLTVEKINPFIHTVDITGEEYIEFSTTETGRALLKAPNFSVILDISNNMVDVKYSIDNLTKLNLIQITDDSVRLKLNFNGELKYNLYGLSMPTIGGILKQKEIRSYINLTTLNGDAKITPNGYKELIPETTKYDVLEIDGSLVFKEGNDGIITEETLKLNGEKIVDTEYKEVEETPPIYVYAIQHNDESTVNIWDTDKCLYIKADGYKNTNGEFSSYEDGCLIIVGDKAYYHSTLPSLGDETEVGTDSEVEQNKTWYASTFPMLLAESWGIVSERQTSGTVVVEPFSNNTDSIMLDAIDMGDTLLVSVGGTVYTLNRDTSHGTEMYNGNFEAVDDDWAEIQENPERYLCYVDANDSSQVYYPLNDGDLIWFIYNDEGIDNTLANAYAEATSDDDYDASESSYRPFINAEDISYGKETEVFKVYDFETEAFDSSLYLKKSEISKKYLHNIGIAFITDSKYGTFGKGLTFSLVTDSSEALTKDTYLNYMKASDVANGAGYWYPCVYTDVNEQAKIFGCYKYNDTLYFIGDFNSTGLEYRTITSVLGSLNYVSLYDNVIEL